MKDLTILYYTANFLPEYFTQNTQRHLLKAVGDTRIVVVSFKPTLVGTNCKNIVVGDIGRSAYNIYKQVLIAAKEAETEYVATAEDDVLYPREHFEYRPDKDVFAYDVNKWNIHTWDKDPVLSLRERRNMTGLIVTRDALIRTLEERFAKYPDPDKVPVRVWSYWAEPGRYDDLLRVTQMKSEVYKGAAPHVMFCAEESLGFGNLGKRKAHGNIQKPRSERLEPWGTAEEVLKLYKQ